jgi:hypothetical protein
VKFLAVMLREKSSFECQQDALDEIAQIRKDMDNRFTFKAPDIAERYVKGRLEICLKFRARGCGQEFECFFRCAGSEIVEANPVPGIRNDRQAANWIEDAKPVHAPCATKPGKSEIIDIAKPFFGGEVLPPSGTYYQGLPVPKGEIADGTCGAEVYRHEPHPVFIAAVSGMQQPQERVPSIVRLQIPNHLYRIGGKLFLFSKCGFKFTEIQSERELNLAFGSLGNSDDNLGQHLIERGPQVMEDFPGSHREIVRKLACELKAPNFLSGLGITFGNDFVSCCCEKGFNGGIEIVDLGFGPLDLGEGRYKRRFKIHDVESIMTKDDDLKGTKGLMGALLSLRRPQ